MKGAINNNRYCIATYKILTLFVFILLCNSCTNPTFAQKVNYGAIFGVNMNVVTPRNHDTYLLKDGLYGGIYGTYGFNNNIKICIEGAYSQKYQIFFHDKTYSAIDVLINQFSFLFPEIPDIKDLIENTLALPMSLINDNVYESVNGRVLFHTFDFPITALYDYKNFTFEAGAYFSYLIGAKTNRITSQNIPLFDMIPDMVFDSIPFASSILNSTFPAYKTPLVINSVSTRDFIYFDYGLVLGSGYELGNISLRLRYCFGLLKQQSPDLRTNQNHQLLQASIAYNVSHLKKSKAKFQQTD